MAGMMKCACGYESEQGSKFCGGCGQPLAGGKVACGKCGALEDSGAKFCGSCGSPMGKVAPPKAASAEGEFEPGKRLEMRWSREADSFAKRIDLVDPQGVFAKGVIVEEGTRALLLQNGALFATLEPGRYDMQAVKESLVESAVKGVGTVVRGVASFFKNLVGKGDTPGDRKEIQETVEGLLSKDSTVILVDSGDAQIKTNVLNVYTRDPLGIDISCNVVLRLQDPVLFFVNVMKGADRYNVSNLQSALYDELHNAFSEVISRKSVAELNSDLSLKQQFENSVKEHLNKTLGQSYGLVFFQLRTISYVFKGYDRIRGIHEEVYLQISEDEAKLQGRKRLFEAFDKNVLQEIAEQTRQTEHYRKFTSVDVDKAKAEAERDLGLKGVEKDKAVDELKLHVETRRKMKEHILDGTKTEEDIAQFLHEADKGKLLREQELKEFRQLLEEKNIDHKTKREFMLKKIDLEQDLEFSRMGIIGEGELKKLELGQEIDYERLRLTAKAGLDLELAEIEEKKKRMAFESQISMARVREAAQREEKLKDKMAEIQATQAEDLADLKTAQLSQELLLNMQRQKQEMALDKARQEEILKLEAEAKRLEMRLKQEREAHDQTMEKTRADQEHELKKIAALSSASVEAIISMSGADQARMIKDLKQTEALRDFSEEKILAMAADKSPEVAKAFQEKYKGMSKEETERLYKMVMDAKDQALADKDRTASDKDRFMQDAMERFERVALQALETQRDAATGVAKGAAEGAARGGVPPVVYPPMGGGGWPPGGGGSGGPGFYNVNMGAGPKEEPKETLKIKCPNAACGRWIIVRRGQARCTECGHDISDLW